VQTFPAGAVGAEAVPVHVVSASLVPVVENLTVPNVKATGATASRLTYTWSDDVVTVDWSTSNLNSPINV
jgi:hypothetical protein